MLLLRQLESEKGKGNKLATKNVRKKVAHERKHACNLPSKKARKQGNKLQECLQNRKQVGKEAICKHAWK